MRTIDRPFIDELKIGSLKDLTQRIIMDPDLDMQIRENYINIYFKGNSILKLTERNDYMIHEKFSGGLIPKSGKFILKDFLTFLPLIKENVILTKSKKPTREGEYEQLMIRSNNGNSNINSDVFITDRQYADNKTHTSGKIRFDLSGITWGRTRRKGQIVPLTFIEVKYGTNNDIKDIDTQILNYYNNVKSNIIAISSMTEEILKIKAELGLFDYKNSNVLSTLKVSKEINDVQIIIALIDYNPNSKLLNLSKLSALPFASQVKTLNYGFAIWS